MKIKSVTKKIIIAAALCVALALTLCSCGSKTALSAQEFISKAESVGLKTQDTSSDYKAYDHVVSSTTAYNAEGSDVLWQADFLVSNAEDKAVGMFESNKATFDSVAGSMATASVGNYNTYEKTGGGKFMYLCRVDKTLLYINIDEKYKDEAKKLIEAMGY